MPLYEYKCHRCGKTFEVLQKFSDEPVTHHQECGGEVEQLISAPTFQFKGTGWYVTDYAHGKSNGDSGHKHESKPGATTESKTETKTETKSESKSESKSDSKPAAKE